MSESKGEDVLKYSFDCRFCQRPFDVPRDDWKLNHSHLKCPHCGKIGDYGQSDIKATKQGDSTA